MIVPFNASRAEILPAKPSARSSTRFVCSPRVSAWWKHLLDAWFNVQITHYGGKYSIERMLALEEYTRNTSLSRVLMVIFASPLPVVVLLLAQESIPLQDPAAGWRANYGFWIRFTILQGVLGYTAVSVIKYLLDGAAFSQFQMIICSVCVGTSYTLAVIAISAHWVFPVPFVNVSLGSIWILFFVSTLRGVSGRAAFWNMMSQRDQLRGLNKFCTVQILMTTFYPAYEVLFNTVKQTRYELPVILVLPLVKLIMKSVLASTIVHKEDTIPEQVILTIDFFDALYLATFLQSLSTTSVAVMMAVDLIQSAVDLRDLYQRTKNILKRLQGATGGADGHVDLLSAIRSLCNRPDLFREQIVGKTRVRSCIYHKLSLEGKMLLETLDRNPSRARARSLLRSGSLVEVLSRSGSLATIPDRTLKDRQWKFPCRIGGAIKPQETPVVATVSPAGLDHRHALERAWLSSTVNGNPGILHEALEALFTAECLVLTEYLETVLPILYGNAILVMVHFPSAQYHTEMEGVTQENVVGTVRNVYIYAVLEFLSFVVFVITVRRNCGHRALHHLAFVLETQAEFVQTKLMLWTLMTMTYRIVHFGADFSFKFAWMSC